MTRQVIYHTNNRAMIAVYAIRIAGRRPELMAELRDGLNYRARYRAIAKAPLKRTFASFTSELHDFQFRFSA